MGSDADAGRHAPSIWPAAVPDRTTCENGQNLRSLRAKCRSMKGRCESMMRLRLWTVVQRTSWSIKDPVLAPVVRCSRNNGRSVRAKFGLQGSRREVKRRSSVPSQAALLSQPSHTLTLLNCRCGVRPHAPAAQSLLHERTLGRCEIRCIECYNTRQRGKHHMRDM